MSCALWGKPALLVMIVAGVCASPAVAAGPSPDPAPVTTTQSHSTPPPPVVSHPAVVTPTQVSPPAQTVPKTTRPVAHHPAKAKKKAPAVHYRLQAPRPAPTPTPTVTAVTPTPVQVTPAATTSSRFTSKVAWIGYGLVALALVLVATLLIRRPSRRRQEQPVTIDESAGTEPAFVHSYLKSIGRR